MASPAQIVLFWGDQHIALYNDAFVPAIGEKHPRALGRPARESWSELWDSVGPLLERVYRTGQAVQVNDCHFLMRRHGYLEEVFFDLSYSAVHEHGEVAGVMCIATETTGRVLADRRLRALRATGLRLVTEGSLRDACAAALETMAAENPLDLPWGIILLDGKNGLAPVAAHGMTPGAMPVPERVPETVLREATPQEIPGGLVLPLMACGAAAGVFVAGVNPHLPLAGDYGNYLGLMAGQISQAMTRLQRAADERRAASRLRESEARFRNLADHAPVIVWMTDAKGRAIYLSRRWYEHTGQTPETGLKGGWLDALHPDDRGRAGEVTERAAQEKTSFQMEYRLRAADGTYSWVIDTAAPRIGGDGCFEGFVGSVLDISDRKRAEEARDLLARELSHRIKNIFMVAGGLASLAARGEAATEAFAAQLSARLKALSVAHDMAKPRGWGRDEGGDGSGTVHDLLRSLMAPYAGPEGANVTLLGDDRVVGYAAANTLALVLHEQATNAVKYGALSRPEGRVRIMTRVEDGIFRLQWRETGGPPLSGPPARRGFGTMLAARSLAGQVHGRMTHDWQAEGLVVEMELPEAQLAR
ncbi:PAS domain-containing sensor histidine kinase [Roseomonas xinghualingensis]|uniref:PAS domain-containing sensor histidine kinase n=1 Tax=Roseomonas xinghualingensis TaxID=2986475 RepID=UPI0021F2462C|nr:PAS domain S-box protein [Roseomonas sp. SXEYE001]